ncbi:MAG: hypothetical protein HC824_15965 [Synechococcales cyanobacterium RM1_1_8]|nr:hypothetical protein [Synechococcales cyanobacterium RM1_1_8]
MDLGDSVWQYKPWWCQPWSILLTTAIAIGGSWQLFHRLWVTGLVGLPVLAWAGFFVIVFPRLARETGLLAEMRQQHGGKA